MIAEIGNEIERKILKVQFQMEKGFKLLNIKKKEKKKRKKKKEKKKKCLKNRYSSWLARFPNKMLLV